MSKKTDAFYYDSFLKIIDLCQKEANYLLEILTNYDASKFEEHLEKMHLIEHEADGVKHGISEALSKAFITPIEREDLAELSHNLDEVADNIEEVLQRFYIAEPKNVTDESIEFVKKIIACCNKLEEMFKELPNFKKSKTLREIVLSLSSLEEDCDRLYLKAYKGIASQTKDVLAIMSWRKIYDYLERCADSCEKVADVVDTIVMKNT